NCLVPLPGTSLPCTNVPKYSPTQSAQPARVGALGVTGLSCWLVETCGWDSDPGRQPACWHPGSTHPGLGTIAVAGCRHGLRPALGVGPARACVRGPRCAKSPAVAGTVREQLLGTVIHVVVDAEAGAGSVAQGSERATHTASTAGPPSGRWFYLGNFPR